MYPDALIAPEVGVPLAAALWALLLTPILARHLRARRAARKAIR